MRRPQQRWWIRWMLSFGLVPLAMGGCSIECDSNNEVEEVVDEIGDEVEDVAEQAGG